MIYDGKQYNGNRIDYVVSSTISDSTGTAAPIGQSVVTPENITAPLSSKVVTVQKDSVINFVILKGSRTNNNTSISTIPTSLSTVSL